MTQRRRMIVAALAGAHVPAGAAMAHEKPPVVLERSGAWLVNYDQDSCSVAGAFGAENQRIIIRLTWFAPSDGFQMLLAGKSLGVRGSSSNVEITFGPGSTAQHTESMNGTSGDIPMIVVPSTRLHWVADKPPGGDYLPTTPEQEKAIEWLELRIDGGARKRLTMQSMGPLMAALRTCTRDLVKTWGFDPAVQAALSSKAVPLSSPGSWLYTSDYPGAALMRGANGLVRFRLDVDPEGHVGACHVLKSIQSPDFEKITCDLIRKRARFKPALDASGKPTPSYYVNTVKWVMG